MQLADGGGEYAYATICKSLDECETRFRTIVKTHSTLSYSIPFIAVWITIYSILLELEKPLTV